MEEGCILVEEHFVGRYVYLKLALSKATSGVEAYNDLPANRQLAVLHQLKSFEKRGHHSSCIVSFQVDTFSRVVNGHSKEYIRGVYILCEEI